MILRSLAFRVVRASTRAAGHPIGRALALLDRSRTWSRAELDAYRDAAFRKLVEHCWLNVPYYHDLMTARGLTPDAFRTVQDVARLPYLTKEDVRREGRRLRSRLHPDRECLIRRSGGTTAEPIGVVLDRNTRAIETMIHLRGLGWMGYRMGAPTVQLVGGSLGLSKSRTLRTRFREWLLNDRFLPAFGLTPDNVDAYADAIRRSTGGVLIGYASAIATLAEHLARRGMSVPGLAAVISTADQMQDEWKAVIQTTLAAPIFGYYGCGEMNAIAYQHRSASGFVIAEEHVIVEAAAGDPDQFNIEGEGDCCLTSLTNYAMPLLRYLNGDRLTLGRVDDGIPHRRILRLDGRAIEYLTTADGHRISGVMSTHMILKSGAPVWKWQIVQGSPTHLEFHYLPLEGATLDAATRDRLEQIMKRYLGPEISVAFIEGGFDVSPSGKHMLVVNRTRR